MGTVIPFPLHHRVPSTGPSLCPTTGDAEIIILPVVRIQRQDEPIERPARKCVQPAAQNPNS